MCEGRVHDQLSGCNSMSAVAGKLTSAAVVLKDKVQRLWVEGKVTEVMNRSGARGISLLLLLMAHPILTVLSLASCRSFRYTYCQRHSSFPSGSLKYESSPPGSSFTGVVATPLAFNSRVA